MECFSWVVERNNIEKESGSFGKMCEALVGETDFHDRNARALTKPWIRTVLLLLAASCLVSFVFILPKTVRTPQSARSLSFTSLDDDGDDSNENVGEYSPDDVDWRDSPARQEFLSSVRADLPNYVSRDMDFSVDPCDNFYEHVCGAWVENTTIPGHLASFDR